MLNQRSYEPELLDEEIIPPYAFEQMLREINLINKWLGGHRVTLQGLKAFQPFLRSGTIHIAEIGSGGGDNLKMIYEWCQSKNINVQLTGIDIRPECVAYAEEHTKDIPVNYIVSDYKVVSFVTPPDIIFNALFCHHFREDELLHMLRWMKENSRLGFFINDLHRHPIAFGSIKLLTQFFSKSFMVKYDAPLSVRRGFTKNEWRLLIEKAGIKNAGIKWKWAFRHLIAVLPVLPH